MPDYDNPAGRLHDLLRRFSEFSNYSITNAWAKTLDVPPEDVPLYLGDVGALLKDTREAAKATGLPAFAPIPRHLNKLSQSIWPQAQAMKAQSNVVAPDPTAMNALEMLSAYLTLSASEGPVPDVAEVDELKAGVRELLSDVVESGIAPEVRRALIHRLTEVLEALGHLEIGGPEAVRRAAEALAASAVIYGDSSGDAETVGKIKNVARKVWATFTVATVVANAALSWDRLVDLTPLGPGHVQEQRALPPGPASSRDGDPGSDPAHVGDEQLDDGH